MLYNKNGYTIDGWILWDANTSLEVVDRGLVTHSGGSIRQTPLVQKLEVNCLIPGIYTLSIFATKNVGFPNYFVEDIGDIPGHINADSGLVTFTFEVPDAVKDKTHWVSFEAQDDSLIKAAKLEPGPTQTLAHKDAAGNWVLNDPPPDPAMELLKCQRYYIKSYIRYVCTKGKIFHQALTNVLFPVRMRGQPTVSLRSHLGTPGTLSYFNSGLDSDITAEVNNAYLTPDGFNAISVNADLVDGESYMFMYESSADL